MYMLSVLFVVQLFFQKDKQYLFYQKLGFFNCQQQFLVYRMIFINNKIKNKSNKSTMIKKPTIRLKIKTNKFIDMIVAIQADKTMRDLAHRVLNCFHQLADQHAACPPKRRDLIVSALKIDDFYISKSQIVGNMLNEDDQIFCVLSKAKPKFPNYPKYAKFQTTSKVYWMAPEETKNNKKLNTQNEGNRENINKSYDVNKQARKSKKQIKKEKKKLKMQQQKMNSLKPGPIITIKPISPTNFSKEQIKQKQIKHDLLPLQKEQEQHNLSIENQINNNPIWAISGSAENKPQPKIVSPLKNTKNQQNQFVDIETGKNQNIKQFLDTTVSMKLSNDKRDYNQQNLSVETKKQEYIHNKPSVKVEEEKKKKNGNVKSILDILSKASQEKQKKNKRKDKKVQKAEKNEKVEKVQDGSVDNKLNPCNIQSIQNGGSLKVIKIDKQCASNNKIASPKVTFHNSPMMSPQAINLNSPKRKISNPALQKIQLEGPSSFQLNSQKPPKKQTQKHQKNIAGQLTQQKKQAPTACPPSHIIVEEDSQQSYQRQNRSMIQTQPQNINSKLAALNSKISKYKLQFFNDSEDDEE